MSDKIIVIGGGEHARVVMEAIKLQPDKWNLLGFVDPEECSDTTKSLGMKRLGDDKKLAEILKNDKEVKLILGVGVSKAGLRKKLVETLAPNPERWATVIHPSATVSESVSISPGTVILGKTLVHTRATIGSHSIVNSGAIIEHDVKIGYFTHIAPGVITGGGVIIGEESFIGLGSRIRDHINIGSRVTVGTGSVVVTDIPDGETVVGVPARRISYDKSGLNISELCIAPSTTLYEALSVIGKYGTMIALVTDSERKLLGVLTDGDVRRALINHNDLNCPVEKFMSRKFAYVKTDVNRAAALDKMKAMVLRQLPVLDDEGKIAGLHLLSELIGSVTKPNIAVIMAGGKGERLRPITENIPKPMLKVAGRPILEHIILHLAGSNVREIYIAVNYLGEMIEDYFKDGSAYGCSIKYIKEEKPLGTIGALSLLPEKPDRPLIVLNGDLITQFDVDGMLHHHTIGKYKMTVGVHDYRIRIPYGVFELDNEQVTGISEKPEQHFVVNGGIYIISPELLERIPKNENFLTTELISSCLSKKEKVGVYFVEGDWIDVGQHQHLAQARGL